MITAEVTKIYLICKHVLRTAIAENVSKLLIVKASLSRIMRERKKKLKLKP